MLRIASKQKTYRPVFHPAEGFRKRIERDVDQLFWRRFAEATTPKAFCQSWLPLQCRMLKDVHSAMVLLGPADKGPFKPAAVWPDAKLKMHHLVGTAERSLHERRGLLVDRESDPGGAIRMPEHYHVAYPIEVSGKIHGTVVLGVKKVHRYDVQSIMRQLHWGAAWLEVLIRRTESNQSDANNKRLQQVLELVASAVEQEDFQASAMSVVTRMANILKCDRVSIGFVNRRRTEVAAVSHSADFSKQTNLVRAIGAAMDEAIDQQAVVVYPPPADSEPMATHAHATLMQQHGAGAVCTIALGNHGAARGGLTLEAASSRFFNRETVELCETAAALVGPFLLAKQEEQRWLFHKVQASVQQQIKRLFGAGYTLRKAIAIGLVLTIAILSLVKIEYRVTAPTVIEGLVQRVVAAPFDGYIKDAPVRPGDLVEAGALLGMLDDRDLKLEHLKWSTEKDQYIKQYNEALANHDRAQIRILRAKIAQADAQIALLDEQLVRCRITAPFDGVIMSGDLSQSLGAPVEQGQVLFEVTPLDDYRVIVEVDERDIAVIEVGQSGELVLSALPDESFPFFIETITPVTTAKEGRNYFRVEGFLEQAPVLLRPGMEGVGKVSIDRRRIIWVWTHRAVDWLRLQLWRWLP